MAINQAKVLTITSVKGGTGKTTNTLNLAGIFSSMKKKVLIIDLDLHTGSIAASMNLKYEKDIYHRIDVRSVMLFMLKLLGKGSFDFSSGRISSNNHEGLA